jgi:PHD/YefM family antitoxin component YafN of YafNO toxin-antitoxin module
MKQVEVTPELEKILAQARQEDVVFTRQGHAVALLSEFDDEELYWYARERDPEFLASLAKARTQVQQAQTIQHNELKRQLGIE